MAISHCCYHLVFKNGNFSVVLTSSGEEWQFHILYGLLTSSDQEWQFHIATDI